MVHRATMISVGNTMLLIFVIKFSLTGPKITAEYSEGLLDTTGREEMIGVTTEGIVGNSSVNPYAKYIFGLPPIPIDPAIKGVESDDDFETLAPFTREFVYNKNWFISGFDKDNCPIVFKRPPRFSNAALKVLTNSTASGLLRKLTRYRKYISKKAIQIRSTKEKPVTRYVLINDFINSNSYASVVTNPAAIKLIIHNYAVEREFYEKYQKAEIILNVGVVAEIGMRLFGRVGSRRQLQVYGPNKAEWLRVLQTKFPRDQLPEEFGGFKDHVPIKLYPD